MNLPLHPLTKREMEVLMLICAGQTNRNIATQLSISTKTVEKHRTQLSFKLCVDAPIPMIRVALRLKLVSLDEFFSSTLGEGMMHNNPGCSEHRLRNFMARI